MKPCIEDMQIQAYFKLLVKGFRTFQLKDVCEFYTSNVGPFEEMVAITIAIAMLLETKLLYASGRRNRPRQRGGEDILRVGKMLFDGMTININTAQPYVEAYRPRPINAHLPQPAFVRALATTEEDPEIVWEELLLVCRGLSILVLCLSHVANLSEVTAFPLPPSLGYFSFGKFWGAIQSWNGTDRLPVREGLWFELLSTLFAGHKIFKSPKQLSLYSNRGWSILLCNFNNQDPEQQDVDKLFIYNAVPSRNSVSKAGVIDGPRDMNISPNPVIMTTVDEILRFELQTDVQRRRTLFGELDDFFSVSLSFAFTTTDNPSKGDVQISCVGYRTLHQSLWSVAKTSNCQHPVCRVLR